MYEIANNPSLGLSSANIWAALRRYTYSGFASQIFGMEIADSDDPVIEYIHETGKAQILATLPGMFMVDTVPALDNLPLFLKPWERDARARFQRDWEWCMEKLERVKKGNPLDDSVLPTAFLRKVIDDQKHLGFDSVEEGAYMCLQLLIGSADTSQMSTWSFLEAMMMFPDVQKKAQLEIDNVVKDRLPVFSDIEMIPYYGGYRIPKGSNLHLNAWAIGHDPRRHEDPERFWPERYLHDKTTAMQSINSSDVSKRDHFAFGSGRRVCPGYNVAERSLAISILRLLWSFDITPAPDTALPLDPASYAAFMPGNPGVNMPVTLTVRSAEKRAIINREYEELNRLWPQMVCNTVPNYSRMRKFVTMT
ncbi:hypothetical protein FDECE_17062 [Fusarium decemcellulare]|nr:hypothetical protein FDECE_17062 [Fusarium decemcellulare]